MIDRTTRETSQLLKDVGFPQPSPGNGQIWYLCRFPDGNARHWVEVLGSSINRIDDPNLLIFAPTAADILKELGKNFMLNHVVSSDTPAFVVLEWAEAGISTIRIMREWIHTNSAEVAAACWLAKNEKK